MVLAPVDHATHPHQVHAAHGLVDVSAPTLGQAFGWQAALARSARNFHELRGSQYALAMLLPSHGSAAAASSELVESLQPFADALREQLAIPLATAETPARAPLSSSSHASIERLSGGLQLQDAAAHPPPSSTGGPRGAAVSIASVTTDSEQEEVSSRSSMSTSHV